MARAASEASTVEFAATDARATLLIGAAGSPAAGSTYAPPLEDWTLGPSASAARADISPATLASRPKADAKADIPQ